MIEIVPGDLITVNKLGMALPVHASLHKPRRSFGNVTCMMPCLVISVYRAARRSGLKGRQVALLLTKTGVGYWLIDMESIVRMKRLSHD